MRCGQADVPSLLQRLLKHTQLSVPQRLQGAEDRLVEAGLALVPVKHSGGGEKVSWTALACVLGYRRHASPL